MHSDTPARADRPSRTDRPSWTDREDQLGSGFRPVRCQTCQITVAVRKMNPAQTSTQWHCPPVCPWLARDEQGRPGQHCPDLEASIAAAIAGGALPIEPTEAGAPTEAAVPADSAPEAR